MLESTSGRDALEMAANHNGPIHLLLTDVVMPDMNGMELATRLDETKPEIAVLYTSGYTDQIIAEHGVIGPDIEFIAKPYHLDDLLSSVREAIAVKKDRSAQSDA